MILVSSIRVTEFRESSNQAGDFEMAIEILKRKSDYALRALSLLASLPENQTLNAHEIAIRAELAEPLLRKLLQKLVRAGIVLSVQGAAGGFRLAQKAEKITVLAVAEAVQGKLAVNRCFLGKNLCEREGGCHLHQKLISVQKHLVGFFEGLTLAEISGNSAAEKR